MASVFAMHGVVDDVDPGLFVHRGMLDKASFVEMLRNRPRPFVPLDRALVGEGDALTIDDATRASAEAARLAREQGHAVTLFVNAYNVEHDAPYFFCTLNAMLDAAPACTIEFKGARRFLGSFLGKSMLRRAIKTNLGVITETARLNAELDAIRDKLGAPATCLPTYLRTVTTAEIVELLALGVEIGNHGWMHVELQGSDAAQQREQIVMGREWLHAEFGIVTHSFAAPFGDAAPASDLHLCGPDLWLMLNPHRPVGGLTPHLYNRKHLAL